MEPEDASFPPFLMKVSGDRCTFDTRLDLPPVCFKCGSLEHLELITARYESKPWYLNRSWLFNRVAVIDVPLCSRCSALRYRALWVQAAACLVFAIGLAVGMAARLPSIVVLTGLVPLVVFFVYTNGRLLPGALANGSGVTEHHITFVRVSPRAIERLTAIAAQK